MPPFPIRTERDFDELSWHDVRVYGFAAVPELGEVRFDMDFIVEWRCGADGRGAAFLVAPATMVFDDVSRFSIQVVAAQGHIDLLRLERSDWHRVPGARVGTWLWSLVSESGTIMFRASGFRLFQRRAAVETARQELALRERGLPSFAVPGDVDGDG